MRKSNARVKESQDKNYSCVKVSLALDFPAMSATLTTKAAAERLGVSPARVRQLVLSGELPAEKFGRDLMIKEDDLKLVADRPMGRPPKAPKEKTAKKGKKK